MGGVAELEWCHWVVLVEVAGGVADVSECVVCHSGIIGVVLQSCRCVGGIGSAVERLCANGCVCLPRVERWCACA